MMRSLTAVLGLFLLAQAAAQDAPPVEAFARLPAALAMSISPDGGRIAYITNQESARALLILDLETGERTGLNVGDLRALGAFWTDSDTLVLRVGQVIGDFRVRGDVDASGLVRVNVETLSVEPFLANTSQVGENFNAVRVVGREARTGHLFMPLRDGGRDLNLYAVDPETGISRTRARGSHNTRHWVADGESGRYARIDYSGRRDRFTVTLIEDRGSMRVVDETRELIDMSVVAFSQDDDSLLIAHTPQGAGLPSTRALQELSLTDGALGELIYQDPVYDFSDIVIDHHSGAVLGVTIERDRHETIWFDADFAELQRTLNASFGRATEAHLIDWTPNRTKFLVRIDPERNGQVYYLLDRTSMTADAVALAYPELLDARLAERRLIRYPAQDGVEIPAYLTLPQGEGPHPFVVLVHGGPASRDLGGFDYMAHFLASRGYGVVQPQFRGSEGFGAAWETAGYGQWARGVMQTDVVAAADHVRSEGLADSVCIAGGSYGGYAALAGASFTPDAFDCALSFNGVSDPRLFLDYIDRRYGRDSQPARYWRLSLTGELAPDRLRQRLEPLSPLQAAGRISIPVLLIHGADDTVVPARQSERMARALERGGSEVRHIELEGGDHWLTRYDTRLAVLTEIEAFLAEHAPAQ